MKKLCLALLLFGVGCISVSAKRAPGVSLSQYRTFAFYPTPPSDATSLDRSPGGEAARQAIARDLTKRGLVESAAPDLYVAAHMKVRREYGIYDYGPAWGYGWGFYGPYYTTSEQWLEGVIIVDLVDRKTNQVVWRGTASEQVTHPDNPDPKRVAKAVDKLMDKLPSDLAAGYTPARM